LMAGDHAQALVIFADVLMTTHQKMLAELSLKNGLPAIFQFREFVDMGGLVSYGSNLNGLWRRAAPLRGQNFKRGRHRRTTNRSANALRIGPKSEHCEDARHPGASLAARPRGRGDRMNAVLAGPVGITGRKSPLEQI